MKGKRKVVPVRGEHTIGFPESDERGHDTVNNWSGTTGAEKEGNVCVSCVWKGGVGVRGLRVGQLFNYVRHSRIIFDWPWHGTAWSLSVHLILSHRGVAWRGTVG